MSLYFSMILISRSGDFPVGARPSSESRSERGVLKSPPMKIGGRVCWVLKKSFRSVSSSSSCLQREASVVPKCTEPTRNRVCGGGGESGELEKIVIRRKVFDIIVR